MVEEGHKALSSLPLKEDFEAHLYQFPAYPVSERQVSPLLHSQTPPFLHLTPPRPPPRHSTSSLHLGPQQLTTNDEGGCKSG
ncbi:hypothetical protein Pmani_033635 [Petrolisthes manimaculis]|uniref:Uncharacterized protein n=1 Tax=Petrolisthes manimaculis TaxID=1843537 RepID=A0AAE1NP38_9EUCA|nr:hypothetical protein Pmani_033635 [Petrolisthes manimaculis]